MILLNNNKVQKPSLIYIYICPGDNETYRKQGNKDIPKMSSANNLMFIEIKGER